MGKKRGWEVGFHGELMGKARVGEHQALLLVVAAVTHATGVDVLAGGAKQAAELVKAHKTETAAWAALAKARGWLQVKPAFAQRGDVAATKLGLGVVGTCGRHVYVATPVKTDTGGKVVGGGLVQVPLAKATQAWRVE